MSETAIKNRRPFGFSNNNSVFEQRQRRLESKRAKNSQNRKKGTNSNTTDAEAPKCVNNENYYNMKMKEQQKTLKNL